MAYTSDAYQVTTTATKLPLPFGTGHVRLYNAGPNVVWISPLQAKCTVLAGIPVSPLTGTVYGFSEFDIGAYEVWVICSVLQASPADLRYWAAGA